MRFCVPNRPHKFPNHSQCSLVNKFLKLVLLEKLYHTYFFLDTDKMFFNFINGEQLSERLRKK